MMLPIRRYSFKKKITNFSIIKNLVSKWWILIKKEENLI